MVASHCIVCYDEVLDVDALPYWPDAALRELYVNEEDTGFLVCDHCRALPRAALLERLQSWVVDVWTQRH